MADVQYERSALNVKAIVDNNALPRLMLTN